MAAAKRQAGQGFDVREADTGMPAENKAYLRLSAHQPVAFKISGFAGQ